MTKCYWCGHYFESGSGHEDSLGHYYCSLRCYDDAQKSDHVKKELEIAEWKRESEREKAKEEKIRKADPNRWYPQEWIDYLKSHPGEANRCPWQNLEISRYQWKELLSYREELARFCPDREEIFQEIANDRKREAYACQLDARWGAPAKWWRIICSIVFVLVFTFSGADDWCVEKLDMVVVGFLIFGWVAPLLILKKHPCWSILPILMYAVFGTNYEEQSMRNLFYAGMVSNVATVCFFSRFIWSLRGPVLTTVAFASGMGWLLTPWPIVQGMLSIATTTWCLGGIAVVLAVISYFCGKKIRGRGVTLIVYAMLIVAVAGKAYLCGVFSMEKWDAGKSGKQVGQMQQQSPAVETSEGKLAKIEERLSAGIEADRQLAIEELKLLADGEQFPSAQKLMGKLIVEKVNGKKIKDSIVELDKAVRYGSVDAMLILGRYYAEGEGFFNSGKDEEKARKYLNMAKEKGSNEAVELLKELD